MMTPSTTIATPILERTPPIIHLPALEKSRFILASVHARVRSDLRKPSTRFITRPSVCFHYGFEVIRRLNIMCIECCGNDLRNDRKRDFFSEECFDDNLVCRVENGRGCPAHLNGEVCQTNAGELLAIGRCKIQPRDRSPVKRRSR